MFVEEDDVDIAQLCPLLFARGFREETPKAFNRSNDVPVVCVAALHYARTSPSVIAVARPYTDRSHRTEVRQ